MANNLVLLVVLMVSMLVTGISLFLVQGVYHRYADDLSDLRARLDRVEREGGKRLTHSTAACLEDAISVNLDAIRYINELEAEMHAAKFRLQQQQEILRIGRSGPHAYDEERPAGIRPGRATHGS